MVDNHISNGSMVEVYHCPGTTVEAVFGGHFLWEEDGVEEVTEVEAT